MQYQKTKACTGQPLSSVAFSTWQVQDPVGPSRHFELARGPRRRGAVQDGRAGGGPGVFSHAAAPPGHPDSEVGTQFFLLLSFQQFGRGSRTCHRAHGRPRPMRLLHCCLTKSFRTKDSTAILIPSHAGSCPVHPMSKLGTSLLPSFLIREHFSGPVSPPPSYWFRWISIQDDIKTLNSRSSKSEKTRKIT